MEDSVSQALREAPRIQVGDISTAEGRVSFILRDPTQIDAAVERLRALTQGVANRQPSVSPEWNGTNPSIWAGTSTGAPW